MEVGYEGIYGFKLIAGVDEYRGLAVYRMNDAVGGGYTLENSRGSSAYGNNSAACSSTSVYLSSDLVGDMKILTVHQVLLYLINLNRSERAESYVESNLAVTDALRLDPLDKLIREMKSGGGSGSRALFFRIDGLVVALVLELFGYVRRQRHIADLIERLVDILIFLGIVLKLNRTISAVNESCNSGAKNPTKVEGCANLSTLSGANEGLPFTVLKGAEQEQLHRRPRLFGHAKESGGNNLRRVNHEHVLGVKVIYNISEDLVLDLARLAVKYHKAAHIALLAGRLSDKLLGKVVVKVVGCESGLYSIINDCVLYLFHNSSSHGQKPPIFIKCNTRIGAPVIII